jgi:hypothetical protein
MQTFFYSRVPQNDAYSRASKIRSLSLSRTLYLLLLICFTPLFFAGVSAQQVTPSSSEPDLYVKVHNNSIYFNVPIDKQKVTVTISNVLGRTTILFNSEVGIGEQEISLTSNYYSSGIYFLNVFIGNYSAP